MEKERATFELSVRYRKRQGWQSLQYPAAWPRRAATFECEVTLMPRVFVGFSIRTTSVTPEMVTTLLGFQPDSVGIKGPDRNPPRATPCQHHWSLQRIEEASFDVGGLFSELIERVRPLASKMPALRAIDATTEVDFYIGINPFSNRIPLFFAPDILSEIAKFGGSFDIDFFESDFGDTSSSSDIY